MVAPQGEVERAVEQIEDRLLEEWAATPPTKIPAVPVRDEELADLVGLMGIEVEETLDVLNEKLKGWWRC